MEDHEFKSAYCTQTMQAWMDDLFEIMTFQEKSALNQNSHPVSISLIILTNISTSQSYTKTLAQGRSSLREIYKE